MLGAGEVSQAIAGPAVARGGIGALAAAGLAAGRQTGSVSLLAVSKTWPASAVRDAASAGQVAFGENYVQEALDKIAALGDLALE